MARIAGVTRKAIQGFLADKAWRFPSSSKVKAQALHRIFDEKRVSKEKSQNHAKCSCSEAIGVYGMLRLMGETS